MEVPLAELEMHQDANTNLFSAHLAMVAQIRNKAGTIVEHFSEDVPRHGALETMESARSEVVTLQRHFVASPGEYVLEAVTVDRNSGKAGAQRISFEVPAPPPGPSLSDLALVRRTVPFNSEADPLEPLRYEDGKIVPDLGGHVAHDAKSISLFFIVHPDPTSSEQAQLDMEVLRNGETIGRRPLQLRNATGPGALPYFASIRAGALPAGNYEVITTLNQTGKTVERTVRFRIDGPELANSSLAADAANPATLNAGETESPSDASLRSRPVESLESHRLVITALPANAVSSPAPDELQSMIEDARKRAVGYAISLPNFVCVEVTDRSVDPAGDGRWRHKDSITELLRYVDNTETRRTLAINGNRAGTDRAELKGALSHGEFGGVLKAVFDPASKADFQWKETDALGSGTVQVISYRVARENSSFGLVGDNNRQVSTGFHGLVYVDSETKGVRRVTLEADELPRDFSIHSASIMVDYDYIAIGAHDYLMPMRATVGMRQGKREVVLNEIVFRNYRRFASAVKVLYPDQISH